MSTNEEVKGKGEVNDIGDKNIIANGGEGLIEKRVVGTVDRYRNIFQSLVL